MVSADMSAEIRGWSALILGTFGGVISLRTYLSNQKQRRLENSFRLISMFWESLHEKDMNFWEHIFHATSEPAGAKKGFLIDFTNGQRVERPLSDLFSEGPPDNGAIGRMAALFDIISDELLSGKLETRLIYFQLGQLMVTIYSWLLEIDNPYKDGTFLEKQYPSFDRLFKENLIKETWACRTYAYIG